MKQKLCIIIGNGDLPRDLSAQINSADYVLRFNRPRHLNGWSGTRTDRLMLCNSGKPMQALLRDHAFLSSQFVNSAGDIVLVYHPAIMRAYFKKPFVTSRILHGRKVDWTTEAIDLLGQQGKPVTVMPSSFYLKACEAIGISGPALYQQFPSTGYLGIQAMLQSLPAQDWQIKLCGFSWQGWKGHNWENERKWVAKKITDCMLTMIE